MTVSPWLHPAELRVGLGCMRLPSAGTGEQRARATIAAALDAGITVFDTARAYGPEPGANERLLAAALREHGAADRARVITKGGMARPDGRWVPDGRARAIRADCEASCAALGGIPIDTYLLHAPDPRTPWTTSVRALARLLQDGLTTRVGLSNVNRAQLDAALELAPIGTVQIALSLLDDRAVRGGVLERCVERGIAVIAHSPLGGPRAGQTIGRHVATAGIADTTSMTAAEVALAWLLHLSPAVVAIPGATRPETAHSAARAARLHLTEVEHTALAGPRSPSTALSAPPADGAEVVLVMGIPGAGKSTVAAQLTAKGYVRLNRDQRGGSLTGLADALREHLAAGTRRVVLDNTYLTRAARSHVIEAADAAGLPARCVWLDTPLAAAQVNLVARLLERFGELPGPEELRRAGRTAQGVMAPTSQMRALRELEPPSLDEGFAGLETRSFQRAARQPAGAPAVFVAAAALRTGAWARAVGAGDPAAPHLVFDWQPDGDARSLDALSTVLAAQLHVPVHVAVCPHPAGPPRCWCRPPLPGLPLAFAHARGLDPSRSVLIGARPVDRSLAAALGARYVPV